MRGLALTLALIAQSATAHELWIEPQSYQNSAETIVTADVVNGENFEGIRLSYIPTQFERFVAVNGGKFANIQGRVGDRPAMQLQPLDDGLHVIAYLSKVSTIKYEEWQKFQNFVDHKDLGDALTEHRARGLDEEGFSEAYTRFSKSLVSVGSGDGADRRLGLETEIVALDNPYTDGLTEIRLELHYQRDLRADEQIEVFEKAPDGTVEVSLYRTDDNGVATVPVKAGHAYMADAVVLREPSDDLAAATGAVWETLWANITWAMPE